MHIVVSKCYHPVWSEVECCPHMQLYNLGRILTLFLIMGDIKDYRQLEVIEVFSLNKQCTQFNSTQNINNNRQGNFIFKLQGFLAMNYENILSSLLIDMVISADASAMLCTCLINFQGVSLYHHFWDTTWIWTFALPHLSGLPLGFEHMPSHTCLLLACLWFS